MQLGERLYALRKKAGMTQTELAEKLDVSRQAISRWELGTAKPDVDNLVALSELYDVTVDQLLKADAEPAAAPEQTPAKKSSGSKWLGFMLILYIVLFAIIAVANFDPTGAIVTAGLIVAVVWGIKLLVCAIIRLFKD